MNRSNSLDDSRLQRVKRVGTGLCFIAFAAIWVFAFAVHPKLGSPKILEARELIARAHGNGLLQAAHALVTVNTALGIVVSYLNTVGLAAGMTFRCPTANRLHAS